MTAGTSTKTRPGAVSIWRRPLLVGICFGLGYGLTQRLLDLRLPELVHWNQRFEPRERPGTSLESLRLQYGSEQQDLRARLAQPPPVIQAPVDQQPAAGDATMTSVPQAVGPAASEPMTPDAPQLPPADAPSVPPIPLQAPPAPRQP